VEKDSNKSLFPLGPASYCGVGCCKSVRGGWRWWRPSPLSLLELQSPGDHLHSPTQRIHSGSKPKLIVVLTCMLTCVVVYCNPRGRVLLPHVSLHNTRLVCREFHNKYQVVADASDHEEVASLYEDQTKLTVRER